MTKKKKRICIFIDGANFYHLVLKKLKIKENDFDFDAFAKHLARERIVINFGKRFYVGTVREEVGNERSKRAMAEQTRLFSKLKKTAWKICTSKLRKRSEEVVIDNRTAEYKKLKKCGITKIHIERWREKGIDVKIATDLLAGAFDNQYDAAIIVSSDTDLIPAIDRIRHKHKKKVEYVGFSIEDTQNKANSAKPTHALIAKSDVQNILLKENILQFLR